MITADLQPDDPRSLEAVVSYATGELSAPEEAVVETILSRSPELATQVARMKQIVETLRGDDSEPVPAEAVRRALITWSRMGDKTSVMWAARARRFIAELVFDTRPRLAPQGYRRANLGTGGYQLAFTCPAGRVDLQILERGDDWRIRGQVSVREAAVIGPIVLLPPGGGETVETMPDAMGRFLLEPPPGVYDLLIELDHGQRAILAPDIEIGR